MKNGDGFDVGRTLGDAVKLQRPWRTGVREHLIGNGDDEWRRCMALTYTCEGCGKTFTGTPEEAFEVGWDTPERFMGHCTCESCPITTTLWWRIQVDGLTELTEAEYAMLLEYNRIYDAANGGE